MLKENKLKVRNNNHLGGVALKGLSIAALAGCAIFGAQSSASAQWVSNPANMSLEEVIQDTTSTDRSFTTDSAEDKYQAESSSGTITSGNVLIQGTVDGEVRSTVDYQGSYRGFTVNNGTSLTLENLKLENTLSTTTVGTVINAAQGSTVTINDVVFSNNSTNFTNITAEGGAIYNIGNITNISGLFENNNTHSVSGQANGGAIFNNGGTIGNIAADFIDNYTQSENERVGGGAIANVSGVINNISGKFINNSIYSVNYSSTTLIGAGGGAIYNDCKIEDIVGSFTGNSAVADKSIAYGGAIHNAGTIGDITGNFTNNSTYAINFPANNIVGSSGGAIGNYGKIEDIVGSFTGNSAVADKSSAYGGAIENRGTIGDITGDFIDNYVQLNNPDSSSPNTSGGAIDNANGTIGNITGNFINNKSISKNDAAGGAISSWGSSQIGNITGNFTNNNVSAGASAAGGAIDNANGTIGNITGNFINNNVSAGTYADGGAIYNSGTIGDITGNFTNNNVSAGTNAYGGAIENRGTIGDITGNFINNSINAVTNAYGGAIYNKGTIGDITGNFINNYSESLQGDASSAINSIGTINSIKGYFESNYAFSGSRASGGALNNNANSVIIEGVTANFKDNCAKSTGTGALARGGAVLNFGYIKHLTGNFDGNKAESFGTGAIGGAVANIYGNTNSLGIDKISGIYTNNSVIASGSGYAYGGAIYNAGTIGEIVNSNFVGNYAKSKTSDAKGGAIYTTKDITLTSKDNFTTVISGNYVESPEGKTPEAIYVDSDTAVITLKAVNNGKFQIDDTINGVQNYTLNLTGDTTGRINLNNKIYNANIVNEKVTTNISNAYNLSNSHNSLTVQSGTMNLGNLTTHPVQFEMFSLQGGNLNINNIDVDLANERMGRITASTYGENNNGTLTIQSMNLLSDGTNLITPVEFADKSYKNSVKTNITEAYTPLYRYEVRYDTSGENGYFVFSRGASGGNPSSNYNPSVLSSSVSSEAGANATVTETFRYVFEHADGFTQLPSIERFAIMNSNKTALSTDFNTNLCNYCEEHNNKGGWVRPYVSFENMNLKNGPKADITTYGTLVGYDTDFRELKHGWHNVGTGYIGYNGSQINYKGVDTTMNGGLLGLTETFYKGNFWTALTLSAGATNGQTYTMYGKEDFTSLIAGLGSKTGYNFEFKEGKYIIQPVWFMSYTFVNTFDYTNASGLKIENDPMHSIQINPSVRFIANSKTGWQPYASVGMVWNLLNETNTTAGGVKLPEMQTKPYVEYGLGLQKRFKENFTAYGQAMIRNGGRNGISLTAGMRWSLGKDTEKEKVEKTPNNKTVLKTQPKRLSMYIKKLVPHLNVQLGNSTPTVSTNSNKKVIKEFSLEKKAKLLKNTRNTTMTTTKAVLKHL